MKKLLIVNIVVAAVFFSSCMTLQRDVFVSGDDIADDGFSVEMQSRLAVVDAAFFAGNDMRQMASDCSRIIADIEKKLAIPELEKRVASRLYALAGRAYLLSGRKDMAQKYHAESQKRNASDSELFVLGRRLGNAGFENALAARGDDGILVLESALAAYSASQFADAAAKFDTAFLLLAPFYKTAYEPLRDASWNLKDTVVADAMLSKLLMIDAITVLQMIEITQAATKLLDIYTGGKKYSGKRLFDVVDKAGLLKSVSGSATAIEQEQKVLSDVIATRILCARFLWNLYISSSSSRDAVKYSTRYRARASKSPVVDVSIESEDFDAVLGTVESEIMALKDGRSFDPHGTVSGVEFNKSVIRVK
ncbi:MAG: hypothetical protein J6I73_07540 [Treponema sp.]|nr:hypothetical protein [Treponema sp.]